MADEPGNNEKNESEAQQAEEKQRQHQQEEAVAEAPDAELSDDEELADPETELLIEQAVEEALAQQRDSVLRAQAEVQNMRRRCEQDVERAHKYALEKFSGELLNVVDNLERALQSVPETQDETVKAIAEGVELTLKGFMETLTRFSVEQLDPHGVPFDPQMHEAMAMVPNPDVEPNTIIDVIQKGYTLNGRVLRPARVVVARGE